MRNGRQVERRKRISFRGWKKNHEKMCATYTGHPITIARTAMIVSPLPYPIASYIGGANRGNVNPARYRMHDTAARADAACRANVSMMYVCRHWKMRIRPMPINAIPCSTDRFMHFVRTVCLGAMMTKIDVRYQGRSSARVLALPNL